MLLVCPHFLQGKSWMFVHGFTKNKTWGVAVFNCHFYFRQKTFRYGTGYGLSLYVLQIRSVEKPFKKLWVGKLKVPDYSEFLLTNSNGLLMRLKSPERIICAVKRPMASWLVEMVVIPSSSNSFTGLSLYATNPTSFPSFQPFFLHIFMKRYKSSSEIKTKASSLLTSDSFNWSMIENGKLFTWQNIWNPRAIFLE